MDVARINLSHGSAADHRAHVEAIKAAREDLDRPVAIMLDTQGPEVRVGTFPGGPVQLVPGQRFLLWRDNRPGDANGVGVSWPGLIEATAVGQQLLLDDGNLSLKCVDRTPDALATEVEVGGPLSTRKKISCPGSHWPLAPLSPVDEEAILMGLEEEVDFLAVSFVRTAEDVIQVRRFMEQQGATPLPIIAKIESALAVENLEAIVTVSDGLMVARGDLGVELPVEEVPWLQKRIIHLANQAGLPVITATQMLESMISRPRPTRAEASDVANAIWDGTDAVMLSAETASGQFPVEAVEMMAHLADQADQRNRPHCQERGWASSQISDAVSRASAEAADELGASAILTATHSGYTATMVSRCRPAVPVVALSAFPAVLRKLALYWGVMPVLMEPRDNTDDMMAEAVNTAMRHGFVKPGDRVVFTAGVPVGRPGTTNMMRVETIAEPFLRGQGIGGRTASGQVWVVLDAEKAGMAPDAPYVLVVRRTDAAYVPLMEQAAAVVVEQGGLTSHAAVVGLTLGIPTVVGVEGATDRLRSGDLITVDSNRGLVFLGRPNV